VTNRIQRHVYFIMFSAREIFYGYMAISIDEKRAWPTERHDFVVVSIKWHIVNPSNCPNRRSRNRCVPMPVG